LDVVESIPLHSTLTPALSQRAREEEEHSQKIPNFENASTALEPF
jgi:hypothetical protein